jgi:hypothetical protein
LPVEPAPSLVSTGSPGMPVRGPFVLVQPSVMTVSGSLLPGFDPALKREVWIRDVPAGSSLSDAARRNLSRPGRLRWLAGQDACGISWEAFEAPRGTSLLALVSTAQPWRMVRHWLGDLVEEIALGLSERRLPPLALDRVWITNDGHAKLLDFLAPDTMRSCTTVVISEMDDDVEVRRFLRSVVCSALVGRIELAPEGLPFLQPPLPRSGTAILFALSDSRSGQLENLRALCTRARQTPAEVSMRSRILLPVLFAVMFAILTIPSVRFWGNSSYYISSSAVLFNCLVSIERLRRTAGSGSNAEQWALETHVASQVVQLNRLGMFNSILWPFRELAQGITERHPSVSKADLRIALDKLGSDGIARLHLRLPTTEIVTLALLGAMPYFGFLGIAPLLLAFVFRGGLILRLFGIAVVDAAGDEVSRWRALLRAALIWSPWTAFVLLPPSAALTLVVSPALACMILGTFGFVMVAGMLWSIVEPARGVQDRLAQTYLVPRYQA